MVWQRLAWPIFCRYPQIIRLSL